MPIHITMDRIADWGAKKLLTFDAEMTEVRRNQVLPVKKYNLLVSLFNTSTILLISALASAVLFAYTAAFVLGAISLFTRFTSERELHFYALPQNQDQPGHIAQLAQLAMNVIGMGRRHNNNIGQQILQRLQVENIGDWEPNEVIVFNHVLWMNKVPIPLDPAARRPEAPAAAPV